LEEATAAMSVAAAAARNNEQKIRRHDDDVNVRFEFELIIEFAGTLLFDWP
jgi:hypothetical protein